MPSVQAHTFYEKHVHRDPSFPVIFHLDSIRRGPPQNILHWHESVELLYFIEGRCLVSSNSRRLEAKPGEIAVINSNHLHSFQALSGICRYYCLIPGKEMCDEAGIHVDELSFSPIVSSDSAAACFQNIIREFSSRSPYYRPAVRAQLLSLFVLLARNFSSPAGPDVSQAEGKKLAMVKAAVRYIGENFRKSLTVEDISRAVGFSKYYFCRCFKEVAGQTVVDYVNFLRCHNANILLSSGESNVTEAAELSGFHNLSYFTKTYKKYMGSLPSEKIPLELPG